MLCPVKQIQDMWMNLIALYLAAGAPIAFAKASNHEVFDRLHVDSMDLRAEDLGFVDSRGKTHHLKDELGRPLILHFWATWCTSCVKEIPELARISSKLSEDGVQLLAVSVDPIEKKADVRDFLAKLHPSVPLMIAATDGGAGSRYWAWGLPTTYFIDAHGKIFARALGERHWSERDVLELFQKRKVSEKSKR